MNLVAGLRDFGDVVRRRVRGADAHRDVDVARDVGEQFERFVAERLMGEVARRVRIDL